VARSLSLKSSTRVRDRLKAGEILEQVVKEEIGNHSLTVTAMIHLCDLLLSELKMTGEDELLVKIGALTEQLLRIAEEQTSDLLLAETYLLQSKLALVELDMGKAEKLMAKAQLIAEERELTALARTVAHERGLLQSQMRKWDLIVKENPSPREMIDLTKLDGFVEQMIQKAVASLVEQRGIAAEYSTREKYRLVHLNLLKETPKPEKDHFRVGIAQVALSERGDILHELYEEHAPGLFGLRKSKVKAMRSKIKNLVGLASSKKVDVLVFPELTIDLNYSELWEDMLALAKTYEMYFIPGSYHDLKTKRNLSVVISPDGTLWEQEKHIPAIIHFKGKRISEGIDTGTTPRKIVVGKTEFGRIAVVICRDFLDMDLRIELKNSEPPIDLIINPAFTPVTGDFKAAHFDARRSVYAYCFFANVAEFGDSLIYTPEKERDERTIPSGEESVIYKDVDLFRLRSERKKWEIEREKGKPFIQSTR
jgi:predicted amidohydrolase